jgi:hypothetical protein
LEHRSLVAAWGIISSLLPEGATSLPVVSTG